MLEAALADGSAHRQCAFEVFTRRLPNERRYGVVAGTARVLAAVQDFVFTEEQLEDLDFLNEQTLEYLRTYRFTGQIDGYREGELYFPNSPILSVRGTFAECVILETVILSILNSDSAVASAAARMVTAAAGRSIIEMGSRRTHEYAAVTAARATYLAGFDATSNLEAARRYGIPASGTAAHAWTLLHVDDNGMPDEKAAFQAQIDALGVGTVLLVDTFDIAQGVKNAVEVAGPELGGVRIDSGDLGVLTREVRAQLDELGATKTKIVVSSDLDEFTIAALRSEPVDTFGVGTSVVTGSGAPTASLVYKLVARQGAEGTWVSVEKASKSKASHGGIKQAVRSYDGSIATEESIGVPALPADFDGRALLVDLVVDGEIDDAFTGAEGVRRAQVRHAESVGELPRSAHRLQDGEPAIPTVYYSG